MKIEHERRKTVSAKVASVCFRSYLAGVLVALMFTTKLSSPILLALVAVATFILIVCTYGDMRSLGIGIDAMIHSYLSFLEWYKDQRKE